MVDTKDPSQNGHQHEEDLEQSATQATYLEKDEMVSLSEEHCQYLLNRHGTLDLDPLPTMGDTDPYNWPNWKKITNLILVAFHACMSTFIAASIIPAYEVIAQDLGVSLQRTSYLTSLQIAIIGGAPLIWRPLSTRFGRRPIFLISLIGSLLFNVGCAQTTTYGAMATCRAFTAFFICPASAIGSAVVVETFFKKDRARYMGMWTLMITLGVPLAPFIFGFVAYHVGYRWIYWILAMINGGQFILYIFLGPETRFIRKGVQHTGPVIKESYFKFHRIDKTPFSVYEFISPLRMAKYPCVMIPTLAYSMVFLFASVLITVEIPQLFAEKFHFNPQQLGLQFLGIIIGSIIGEQIGGYVSDYWMGRRSKHISGQPAPEFRLWLSYFGYVLTICGMVVFLVRIQQAPEGHWNVTPVVGAGIAAAGNQVVTTVLITYAVDCYPDEAASIGVFITFVRQIWGFIGPFWFPPMFENVGIANSGGIAVGLVMAVSFIPTIALQGRGYALRGVMKART
ncbi:MFS general substrate transporter [Lindgomyces ingoldianus]|uniref:MFS general substrate transporter n=1 Tax=Lindgomyces ingoldianus TaxID=673940 RepID=A0ACB6REC9_9PLEO|nr:MFS general substrate transporter [Lindgomyces ingoldianus]KAF2477624.1 MFS general substrate transporter [Lindgomyces ingoldianus]